MKFKIPPAFYLIGIAGTSVAQDYIYGQGDSTEPASGERVVVNVENSFERRSKTAQEIESEVIRYLAVQLTNGNMAGDLTAFLELDTDQVDEILRIIKPIENHHLDLEIERVQAMCGEWATSNGSNNAVNQVDVSLSAYDVKLREQGEESIDLYSVAISAIEKVIGTQNQEEWNEYLIIQRERMARAATSYFHQNVLSSANPAESIEATCGGH
ncbi:MAG: hypothetical protein WDZ76_06205 [Pseudohongiellaceae bacterium]